MSVVTYDNLAVGLSSVVSNLTTRSYTGERRCSNCSSLQIIEDGGELVCRSCGRVYGCTYDFDTLVSQMGNDSNGYKRCFYFNERCTRWACVEPKIHDDIWQIIREEASNKQLYGTITAGTCNRALISKILRNVKLTPEVSIKHKSHKFKKQLLTKKRFYDKYYEKWKTIRWKLTGEKPILPSHQLIERVKGLFAAAQEPFERHRHHERCDGRPKCCRYFPCWHNFINYDYTFRIFLQICDQKYGFKNSYELFKDEFPLASQKIVKNKLRPMMTRICQDNGWKMPELD